MSERVDVKRNRYGYTIAGDYFRRVTTLNAIPKPALPRWAANEVTDFALENVEQVSEMLKKGEKRAARDLLKGAPRRMRDDAADHGTAVHETIESLVKGEPLPDTLQHEEEIACAIHVEDMLERLGGKVLASEVTVFHPGATVPYAGTFDLWMVDPAGVRWLLDFKTGKGIYPNHGSQLAAYRFARHALVRTEDYQKDGGTETWTAEKIEWGPGRVDRLGIVHVRPEGAKLHPIREEVVQRLWRVFRAASFVKLWMLDTDSWKSEAREPVFGDVLMSVEEESEKPEEVVA